MEYNLYYYDSSKLGEIDFVIQNGMHIDLIEVKSGNNYISHKALDNILNINNWNFKNAYVLCKDNIKLSEKIDKILDVVLELKNYISTIDLKRTEPDALKYINKNQLQINDLKTLEASK